MKETEIDVKIKYLGHTHFPTHFAVKTAYLIRIDGQVFQRTFWQWFLDGHGAAIILN